MRQRLQKEKILQLQRRLSRLRVQPMSSVVPRSKAKKLDLDFHEVARLMGVIAEYSPDHESLPCIEELDRRPSDCQEVLILQGCLSQLLAQFQPVEQAQIREHEFGSQLVHPVWVRGQASLQNNLVDPMAGANQDCPASQRKKRSWRPYKRVA